jgi:hypothetical protein
VPEAAKARGRKGADSQKQNLKVRGVHSVFTAQRYQKWLKTGVVPRPNKLICSGQLEMVKNQPYYIKLKGFSEKPNLDPPPSMKKNSLL